MSLTRTEALMTKQPFKLGMYMMREALFWGGSLETE